jgi:hypothetical protein
VILKVNIVIFDILGSTAKSGEEFGMAFFHSAARTLSRVALMLLIPSQSAFWNWSL